MQSKPTLIKNINKTKKLIWTSAIALAGLTSAIEVNAAVHWSMEAETNLGRISDNLLGAELLLKNGASVSAKGKSASGNALKLDGKDDFAVISHDNYNFVHSNVRIELAAKADDPTATGFVFDRWGQLTLRVTEDGFHITAFHAAGGAKQKVFTPSDWDSSQWNQLAVEISGKNLTVFVNDVKLGAIALKGGLAANPTKNALYIGQRYNGKGKFAGYIDEVKITK